MISSPYNECYFGVNPGPYGITIYQGIEVSQYKDRQYAVFCRRDGQHPIFYVVPRRYVSKDPDDIIRNFLQER